MQDFTTDNWYLEYQISLFGIRKFSSKENPCRLFADDGDLLYLRGRICVF